MVRRKFLLCITSVILSLIYYLQTTYISLPTQSDISSYINHRYILNYEGQDTASSSCFDKGKSIKLKEFFSVVPVSSDNVFLIWPLEPLLIYRSLCAVESWAFNHPNTSIWFTFTVDEVEDPEGKAQKLLDQYPNLQFIYSDVGKLFDDTPLYNLALKKAWKTSDWPGTHLSDFMRQAMIWQKGGYYADTDIYIVKNLIDKRNFISGLKGGIDPMLMHNDPRHPWTKAYMETIANDYHPELYIHHGPKAAKTTAKQKCGLDYLEYQANQTRDCWLDGHKISFLDKTYCPYPCQKMFDSNKALEFEEYLEEGAHGFHLCNVNSRYEPAAFGTDSLLDNAAKKNCPLIYERAQRHSNFW